MPTTRCGSYYKRLAVRMAPGPRKWLLERDSRLLKVYEGRMVRTFAAVLTVKQEGRAVLLEAPGADLPITVIPIVIGTAEVHLVVLRAGDSHILHLGTMY